MLLPRLRTSALVVALTLALAACGGARPTSSLVATATPAGATTTAPPTSAPVTTTVAAAPTTVPATTATAVATSAAPDAGTAAPTTAAPALTTPGAPAPTTAAPTGGPLEPARVGRLFTGFGYAVTDAEATCLAREMTAEAVVALEQGGDPALVGPVTSAFVMALARCEPLSFLEEQDGITVDDYGVTPTEARCVTKALDAAARNDPAVALAYYEGTSTLPATGQQQLIDALTPCVGAAKAREIITT